jgi:membrane-bound lytic murein transglycosylase D
MGRYFLRRKIIIPALLLWSVLGRSLDAQPLPVRPAIQQPMDRKSTPSAVLWPRQGFMGPEIFFFPVDDNPAVAKEIKLFANSYNFKLLVGLCKRSKTYRDFIIAEIEKRALPPELFFIPFVESQWRIKALSRSGAAGLWQLMKVGVKKESLIMDEWLDERYDFWKSTAAALDILQGLYSYYGDWLLALAAYNCGITRLNRIIKHRGAKDFWILYNKGALPRQTGSYVVRILAVARMCSYAGRNGLPCGWEEHTAWCRVPVGAPADLKKLALLSGVPYELLVTHNAELRFGVTPPASHNYRLKIPVEYKERLEAALTASARELLDFSVHTVYSGETLYGIARYYRISTELIMFYNRNVSAKNFNVGMKLLIPVIHGQVPKPDVSRNFSGKQFVSVHVVKRGETLFYIAQKYKVPVEELLYHNGLSLNSIIKSGDTLKVPYKYTD